MLHVSLWRRNRFSQRLPVLVYALIVFVVIVCAALMTNRFDIVNLSISNTESTSKIANSFLSPVFTPEVHRWSPLILAWQNIYGVDADLIATLIQIESCGYAEAVSTSGALGLFQVMPFHFLVGENGLDVATNGQRGMEYLVLGLRLSGGDVGLALAGYNGGHSMITRPKQDWSDETRRYYQWGMGIYQDAKSGLQQSPTLEEWLGAGGSNLCRMARSYQELW